MNEAMESFAAVRKYLYGLRNSGAKYGIDRMRLLSARLDHPERRVPVIHLAGTNGKGSTSAMLEAIFRSSGYRTGMFTSPHLIYQGERVQVNRENLPHGELVRYVNELRPVAEAMAAVDPEDHPSFFELMTAIAFLRFAEKPVDIAIIETGLGGELDATNVVEPAVTVITSIGRDHVDLLGGTIESIVQAKAGIIKSGVPVVIGLLGETAERLIRARAQVLGCRVVSVREVFGDDLKKFPQSRLEGDYQRINAAMATLAAELMSVHLPVIDGAVQAGLNSVEWAGRWDRRPVGDRTVILDATHNEEGVVYLRQQLKELVEQTGCPLRMVAGTLGVSRAESLMAAISPFAREIHLVVPNQPRACSYEELEAAIPREFDGPVIRSTVKSIFPEKERCSIGEKGETIVVTGSIYLLGEVMEHIYLSGVGGEQDLQD